MPYPLIVYPSVTSFLERLEREFGCSVGEAPSILDGDGNEHRVCCITRTVGETKLTMTQDFRTDCGVPLSILRLTCRRLQLDPKEFGLILG